MPYSGPLKKKDLTVLEHSLSEKKYFHPESNLLKLYIKTLYHLPYYLDFFVRFLSIKPKNIWK